MSHSNLQMSICIKCQIISGHKNDLHQRQSQIKRFLIRILSFLSLLYFSTFIINSQDYLILSMELGYSYSLDLVHV